MNPGVAQPLANGARDAGMHAGHGDRVDADDKSGESGSSSSSSSGVDDLDRASSFSSCDVDEDDGPLDETAAGAAAAVSRRGSHHLHTASMDSGGSGLSLADLAANPLLGVAVAAPLRSLSSQMSAGSNGGPPVTPARGLRTLSAGGVLGSGKPPSLQRAAERVPSGVAAIAAEQEQQQQQQQQQRPGTPQTRALSPVTPSPQPPKPAQVRKTSWHACIRCQERAVMPRQ